MANLDLKLSKDHDIEALAATFKKDGAVRIENLFPKELAESIHIVLRDITPWHVVYSDDEGRHIYHRPEEWAQLSNEQRNQKLQAVFNKASTGFAYFYACYPMIRNYLENRDPDWPLHSMLEFLNSPDFHNFVKTITNETDVIKVDAQATLYGPGHFLNIHDDVGDKAERRVAYVMGFTKGWSPNWGGHLLMLDDDDKVTDSFVPNFNSLTLFKVPRRHIVTQVANFTGNGRYSITGWLLDK